MRTHFLPFAPPSLGEEEIQEVTDTLRSSWITTGPKVRRLEEAFAAFVGAQSALCLNSGTAAMHVALAALGVGPGDAVITTPMTFVSTVHVIEHVGATPVLVDVEPDTLNLDPRQVERALHGRPRQAAGRRIRVVLPVHLYGHPCDMHALLALARAFGLAVVEDAAHALPSRYEGQHIGAHRPAAQVRIVTCFSFYATKNMTTAEGGMVTGPPEVIEEARLWSLHGMSRDAWQRYTTEGSWFYEVVRPGFKYNMTDIQAAIGLHQLRRLPQFQVRRREIARQYHQAFGRLEELQIPVERPMVEHAWHLYVVRLNLHALRITRAQFIDELKDRKIGSSVHFIPVHLHPYYRDRYGYSPEDFPVAFQEYQRTVSLPLYPAMTDQDVQDVIDSVVDVVTQFRR